MGKYIISQYKPMWNQVLLVVGEEKNVKRAKYKGSFKSSTNILFIVLSGGKLVIKIKGEGSKEFFSPKDFLLLKKINRTQLERLIQENLVNGEIWYTNMEITKVSGCQRGTQRYTFEWDLWC